MRQRWSVVLVDEFQDTDPVQWQVLDRAFTGHSTMVLIGDPKQAIYAFRGGDVTTYLQAAATATTRKTLGNNWRSDAALVDSLQVMLRGAALGDDRIVVRDVTHRTRVRACRGAVPAPRGQPRGARPASQRKLGVPDIRPHVYADVARDIKRLLTSDARFEGRDLQPRDVAVIAYRNNDLQEVQRALADIGVPAVVAGSGSVFATPAATEWLQLLEARAAAPVVPGPVRGADPFRRAPAAELDAGGDSLTDEVADLLRDWAELFASRGVAAVLEAAAARGLTARVLSRVDGERLLTDLRHVGQSLHQVATEERLGLVATLTWLRAQMADDKVEVASDRTRRLDSDAAAVQLVTIHGSKGLEYPVVYLPTLWDRFPQKPDVPLFHRGGRRPWPAVHRRRGGGPAMVGQRGAGDGRGRRRVPAAAVRRDDAGAVPGRGLVGACAAQHPVLGAAADAVRTPAGMGVGASEPGPARRGRRRQDPQHLAGPRRAVVGGGPVAPAARGGAPGRRASPVGADVHPVDRHDLASHVVHRTELGAHRLRTLTGTGRQRARGAPEGRRARPEHLLESASPAPAEPSPDAVASPMGGLPVGATFGSLVHAVLEHADPEADDFRAELLAHIEEQLVRWPVALDPDELADALVQVCDSPLGPLAGDTALRQIRCATDCARWSSSSRCPGATCATTRRPP